jgi:hypothetical protein
MDAPLTEEELCASKHEFWRQHRGEGLEACSTCAVCWNAVYDEEHFAYHWDICYGRGRNLAQGEPARARALVFRPLPVFLCP